MRIPAFAVCSTLALTALACGDDGSGGAGGSVALTSSSVAGSPTSGNTTSSNASTTSGGNTTTGMGTSMQLSCNAYCTAVTAACTGTLKQYFGTTAAEQITNCETLCGSMPVGVYNDGMDSLGCRTYHTEAAAVDAAAAAMHCEHAGPLGGTVCGADERAVFCNLATDVCPTEFPAGDLCETDIAAIEVTTPYSQDITSGNTLACRMYHLTAAVTDAPMHCPHADGAAPCQ